MIDCLKIQQQCSRFSWFFKFLFLVATLHLGLLTNMSCAQSEFSQDFQVSLGRPLMGSNQLPLQDLLAVPNAQSAFVLPSGRSILSLQYEVANSFTNDRQRGENIWIDGEKQTITLSCQKAFTTNWQVGIELPLIHHSGGYLDDFIHDWHKFWDLPDGGRESTDFYELDYRYAGDRNSVVLDRSSSGIGDVRIHVVRSLWQKSGKVLGVLGQLKLPTGDSDSLRGSGSTDAAIGIDFSDKNTGALYNLSYYAGIGAILLGDGDVLDDLRREAMVYGRAGAAWQALSGLSLKVQFDAHSAGYDSQLGELGDSYLLVLGGSVRVADQWLLDFGVSEDLVVNSAQDVSLFLQLSYMIGADK